MFGYLVISTGFSHCSGSTFVKILYAVVNLIFKTFVASFNTLLGNRNELTWFI